MFYRGVLRAGVVLGDPHQCSGKQQPDGAGAEKLHLTARCRNRVVWYEPHRDKVESNQGKHPRNRQAFVQRGHDVFHARCGLDKKAANDGCNDGYAAQCQGVQHGV